MSSTAILFSVLIVLLVILLTATINYYNAKKHGLNEIAWFLKGIFLPFVSIIFLNQEIARHAEKLKKQKRAKLKAEQEKKPEQDESKPPKRTVQADGLSDEELRDRVKKKTQILNAIREKHSVKVENLEIKTNDDLKQFMNGLWIYENPKNATIFQVFIFKENSLRVDASFPRFAMSSKEVSYTTTLMGNYLRLQGKPQKIFITAKNEVVIGSRKLIKLSKSEFASLADVLYSVESDLDMLFGSPTQPKNSKDYRAA